MSDPDPARGPGDGLPPRRPEAIEPILPEPPRAQAHERPRARYRVHPAARRVFRRGPWEWVATALIAVGVVMLMQPFALVLYSWSFTFILTGTLTFLVVSHFPD